MKVQVKPLRQRGARLSIDQIAKLQPTAGVIVLYGLGTTLQISLYDGSGLENALIPDLYDARLTSMHGNKMLFAGIERTGDKDAAQYLQEWSVAIVSI